VSVAAMLSDELHEYPGRVVIPLVVPGILPGHGKNNVRVYRISASIPCEVRVLDTEVGRAGIHHRTRDERENQEKTDEVKTTMRRA